jgi:hypothetical protein
MNPRLCGCGLVLFAVAACARSQDAVETGLLLRFENAAEAPVPDEVRLFLYDQGGRLFHDERLPRSGPLTPRALPELGSLLVYPGQTQGPLRGFARGYRASQRVSDAVIKMIAVRPNQVVEATMRLSPDALDDRDQDGVPDEIDNCPQPNPEQKGCAPGPDADPPDATGDAPAPDAMALDAAGPPDGGTDTASMGADGAAPDAPRDVSGGRPNGQACVADLECLSGHCVDSVCCNERCDGKCRACDRNRGTCTPHPAGTDPEAECGLYTCDGQAYCYASCPSPCSNNCGARAYCSGQRCVADLDSGSGCSSNCQCESGLCESRLLAMTCR